MNSTLINEYASKLQNIYDLQTAGDCTYVGILWEFVSELFTQAGMVPQKAAVPPSSEEAGVLPTGISAHPIRWRIRKDGMLTASTIWHADAGTGNYYVDGLDSHSFPTLEAAIRFSEELE